MATRSTSRRLTASTIASTYGRLIVGPTWTSLICGDREAFEPRRQPGDGDVDANDARGAAGVDEAPQGHEHGGDRDRACRRLDQGRQSERPGTDRIERDDAEQSQVAHEGEHEQRREQAHADQADPSELDAEAAPAAAAGAEAERQRQGGDEEQQRKHRAAGERAECGDEAPADVAMEQHREGLQGHRRHLGPAEAPSMPPTRCFIPPRPGAAPAARKPPGARRLQAKRADQL